MILLHTDAKGVVWRPYVVSFENDEGTFHTSIYATSREHAEHVLIDLRETAKLVGPLVEEGNL